MIEKKCQNCKKNIIVRLADHRRGWGKFCSKSCKAIKQEKKTGQYRAYMTGVSNLQPERIKTYIEDAHPFSSEALGQWDD